MIELALLAVLLIAAFCALPTQAKEYGLLAAWLLLAIGALADPLIALLG